MLAPDLPLTNKAAQSYICTFAIPVNDMQFNPN